MIYEKRAFSTEGRSSSETDPPTQWKQRERLGGWGGAEVAESDVGLPGPAKD